MFSFMHIYITSQIFYLDFLLIGIASYMSDGINNNDIRQLRYTELQIYDDKQEKQSLKKDHIFII